MNDLAQILKGLSEPTRLEIAALLLWHGELCVCDVEGVLGITQSKASRHLRYMLHAGLVKNRRAGLWMHYYIPKRLDAPQRQVVAMLRRLLTPSNYPDLKKRAERWLKKKAAEGETC